MDAFEAQEDLRYIREMLADTRQRVADNGLHYIIWSVMPAIGIIGTYSVVATGAASVYILWIWAVVIALGWVFSFLIGKRDSRSGPMNFAERILVTVWVASGISMTIIAFAGMLSGAFSPQIIPALIASVIGIPYFIVSVIYQRNWFRLLSAGWWAAAVAFFIWDSFHTLAALGVLIVLFQALPGVYMYRAYGKKLE